MSSAISSELFRLWGPFCPDGARFPLKNGLVLKVLQSACVCRTPRLFVSSQTPLFWSVHVQSMPLGLRPSVLWLNVCTGSLTGFGRWCVASCVCLWSHLGLSVRSVLQA